ncbi:TPA: YlcG family protein [Klebsiella quasipneumoniae subsp. quasipneumoniae]|nr:YlcG family protein [Klebsiella quasipneumoniae subsp. quasipneumoniae]
MNEYRISFRIECHIHDLRHRGTFLVGYRILMNFVRIYQILGESA